MELQRDISQFPKAKGLRLPYSLRDVYDADVQPPSGVSRISLQEVNISFDFSSTNAIPNPGPYPWIIPNSGCFVTSIENSDVNCCEPLRDVGLYYPTSGLPHHSQDGVSQSPSYNDPTRELLEIDSPFSSQQSYPSSLSTYTRTEQSGSIGGQRLSGPQPFILLLDSGFRSILCDRPYRTMAGIKINASEGRISLADLAPSIFSPGYHFVRISDAALYLHLSNEGFTAGYLRPDTSYTYDCKSIGFSAR